MDTNKEVNVNKNIGKALFQVEKLALLIISMILIINITINGLVSVLDQSTPDGYFIGQIILDTVLFGFVYLMIYGINQAVTSIPFLVSLNCPRRMLAKNIISKGASRSLIITLIFFLIQITIYKPEYGLISSVLGIDLTSGNLSDILMTAGIIYLASYLVYGLVTMISLLGVRFGWEYVLSSTFVILGAVFLLIKPIVLLTVFGWNLNIFMSVVFLLIIGINLINYRLIRDFEYKN